MTNTEIITMLIEELKKVSTPKRQEQAQANFPSRLHILGVRAPDLKAIVKTWSSILYDFSPQQWIQLCLELSHHTIFECQTLAFELLWKNKKALKALTEEQIIALGNTLDNWVSTDTYSTMIAGWHWREGTLPNKQIKTWLASPDRWLRRTAVVCTVPLNLRAKGGTGDTERTLMVCEQVIDDRDDMVIKALSWALRVLSRPDRLAVEQFMEKHWERLHGRVRREVTTKLTTGRKNG